MLTTAGLTASMTSAKLTVWYAVMCGYKGECGDSAEQ